jgi:septal ring factor EnvC (AmiA/AmiB activator)
MKHLLLLLAFVIGFASFPAATLAKDKGDDWHKAQKEVRNELNALQKSYDIYKDRVKYMGGDRRQWQALHDVRADIDDISAQVDSGNFDPRDMRNRIQRANDNLRAIQAQLDNKNNRPRGGGFYQPPN